ncbi:unnamed protein product, partial [Hapterophycus canaliculatus]
GVGLDALSLGLLEIALSARAHAPAVESHRALASPTGSACSGAVAQAPSSPGSLSSPGAWVVLLPAGDVVCSPEELDLSSGTCPTAGGGAEEGGQGGAAFCVPPTDAPEHDGDGRDGGGDAESPGTEAPLVDGAFVFDHVYGGSARGGGQGCTYRQEGDADGRSCSVPSRPLAAGATTAVLYGVVGSPAMMGFHSVLKAAAEAGTVRYAFRHALPYGGGEGVGGGGDGGGEMAEATTPLQGYGVVLDVKNMEYQNFDSSDPEGEGGEGEEEGVAAAAAGAADGLSIVEGEEVGGVVFSTLAARRPELKR